MGKLIAWETRAEALGLLTEGVSAKRAARRTGVAHGSVENWARVAGMNLVSSAVGGLAVRPAVTAVADVGRRYRRLTLEDRAVIHAGLALDPPLSLAAIARELGVHRSTVARDVARHAQHDWSGVHYDARVAHYRARLKVSRSRPSKLESAPLRAAVVERLNLKFSPAQVAADLRRSFPGVKEMQVSHETIYQALYVQGTGALRHELTVVKALRSGRTGRIPQSKLPARSRRPWLDGARLSDRPAEVADRAIPGHWEGDLVVGPSNSGIVTLVERHSRFTLLGRLPAARDSATVIDVLTDMVATLPHELMRTLTWDQGNEMARHADFTIATGCPVFFCDPHSPWQRGTNENTNGLIRDFYPKGTNFNHVTDTDLTHTARLLNIRPRQTLKWATPAETLEPLLNVALTT